MTDVVEILREAKDHTATQVFDLQAALVAAERRLRRRRRQRMVVATTAMTGVLGVLLAAGLAERQAVSPASPAPRATVPTQDSAIKTPDFVGLTSQQLEDRLIALGMEHRWRPWAHVASNNAPVGAVLAQNPPAGAGLPAGLPVELTLSAGGPAVDVSQLPPQAAALVEPTLMEGEKVLVVQTAEGVAYKTDALLAGPCAAVRLAYRTFPDPDYGDRCY
ncbi:MAG TPA: PASTA domain-containing protein [Actinomycetales bacterium]|jgi:hypothetical protein|nr:PASTA domain-containing protein [Actinomycetales bacterium]